MLILGKSQELIVLRTTDIGVYLGEKADAEQAVLLPRRYVPEGLGVGDAILVFLYKDSEDRLIATTDRPKLEVGGMAVLEVAETTGIGAFLKWGMPKDLLLPFHEMRGELKAGQKVFVTLYVDHSDRLAASMRVDRFFSAESPYKNGDEVSGHIYGIDPEIGAFVAVDDRFYGLIPRQELFERVRIGQEVTARVTRVRPDGKLNLSIRRKAYKQMKDDAEIILEHLESAGGILGLGDKSDAAFIKAELSMSKAAYKRAIGGLMKAGKIRIYDDRIEKL